MFDMNTTILSLPFVDPPTKTPLSPTLSPL